MDRISALRNVEDALAAFEAGESDLATVEREVRAIVRTYATEFDGDLAAYRAVGEAPADGLVVVAPGRRAARDRIADLLPSDADARFEVEPVG